MDQIENQVAALELASLEGLRALWRQHCGDEPPKIRSPEFLRCMLAFQIQAAIGGGLTYEARRKLRGSTLPGKSEIGDGARLVKEWGGEHHVVVREEEGYAWNGRTFRSLSAVAAAITGVKHNGPRFFGLRDGAER